MDENYLGIIIVISNEQFVVNTRKISKIFHKNCNFHEKIFIKVHLFEGSHSESVSFIHKNFSTESVFYRKYEDLV